jgi:hypothetical protein
LGVIGFGNVGSGNGSGTVKSERRIPECKYDVARVRFSHVPFALPANGIRRIVSVTLR